MTEPTRDRILGVLVALGVVIGGQLLLFFGAIALVPDDSGGFQSLFLGANPGITVALLGPPLGWALRKRRDLAVAFAVTMGLVFLLNAACWGVVGASGGL